MRPICMGSRLPLRSCVTAAIVFQLVGVVDGIWHRLVFFFRAYPNGIRFVNQVVLPCGITRYSKWYYHSFLDAKPAVFYTR